MDQTIRVSARGEFGQLTRGLKQLRGDLKNVTDEMSRGARKGMFDDSQLRALDLFKKRFTETLQSIDREFEKQNEVVEDLQRKMESSQRSERNGLQKSIQDRERVLDQLRREVIEYERLFKLNEQLAQQRPQPGAGGGGRPNPPAPAQPPAGRPPAPSGGQRSSQGVPTSVGALDRALKQLQRDLKDVVSEVDKGARKGGVFTEQNLQTLDIFKRRFRDTMKEVDADFDKQNEKVDELHEKMRTAQGEERNAIRRNLSEREKELDVLRQQLFTIERIYEKRTSEAGGYRVSGGQEDIDESALNEKAKNTPLDKAMTFGMMKGVGLGKGMLGLAGIGGIGSVLSDAYQQAYGREVNSLDLAQRLRGNPGRSGSAVSMYDTASEVGRRDNMGYSASESWQFLDQYSRMAGSVGPTGQEAMMKFARGYGLSTSEVAGGIGSNRQLGGTSNAKQFADAIAGSVESSGMTPRILEVMETNNVLLGQMNTTLKDGSAKQLLAYQSTLDTIGNSKGMAQLTGAQGANLLGGLGGIFSPQEDNWKWMGIRALQSYKPEKYGNMDLFDLEMSYEDGMMNEDNIPAMAEYIRSQSGGNKKLEKRIMQRWLTDGGFAATKREASEFYDATNGLRSFNPDQMEAMKNGSLDATAKYTEERQDAGGQDILQANAEYEKAIESVGSEFIDVITAVKEAMTGMITSIDSFVDAADAATDTLLGGFTEWLNDQEWIPPGIKDAINTGAEYIADNPEEAAAAAAAAAAGVAGAKSLSDKAKAKKDAAKLNDTESRAARDASNGRTGGAGAGDADGKKAKGKGLLKGLSKLAGPLGAFLIGSETSDRMEDGESGWGAFANSLLNGATFGLTDWMGITAPENQERSDANKAKNKATEYSVWKGKASITQPLVVPGKDGKPLTTPATKKASQRAYDYLTNDLGVDPSTLDGADLITKALTGNMGYSADSLPDDFQAIREKLGIGNMSYGARSVKDSVMQSSIEKYFLGSGSTDAGESGLGLTAYTGGADYSNLLFSGLAPDVSHPLLNENTDRSISQMEANIGNFSDTSTNALTGLEEEGVDTFLKFRLNGTSFFDGTQEEHTDRLADIYREHKGLKGVFERLSEPVVDGFDTLFGDVGTILMDLGAVISALALGGSGTSTATSLGDGTLADGSFDIRGNSSSISISALDAKLGGVLKGKGAQIAFAGEKYGINPAVLAAIMMHETGNGTSDAATNKNNVGGMMKSDGSGLMSFDSIDAGIDAMASNLDRNYVDKGITTLSGVQQKYAPVGANNDPNNLNSHWTTGVTKYLEGFGISGSASSTLNTNSFFSGWEDRVTSEFGAKESFRKSPHRGLDINGEQGDPLQALKSGTVSFIYMDDGGKLDEDGKKNTRAGGTEVGIKMSDGSTYFYSHLSRVDPNLKVGDKIAAGQQIGNLGGDKGVAGSGSSTTGSHLHLGYMDANRNLMNPRKLLEQLDIGDSSIGNMADQMPMQNRADLAAALSAGGGTSSTINVNITSEGATKLNAATESQLRRLITSVFKENERMKTQLVPTKGGA